MQPTAGHRSLPISGREQPERRVVRNKDPKEKTLEIEEVLGLQAYCASDMWMPGLEAEVLCIRHVDAWVGSRGFVHQTCGCLGWKQRFCASDM